VPESQVFINPALEIDNTHKIEIPLKLTGGYIIKYEGNNQINVYENNWSLIHSFSVDKGLLTLDTGVHKIKFRGEVVGKNPQPLKLEFKTKERISYF
jgi:hypothetical protein